MEVLILQLLEGARAARGLAVIIDVFRAFSTACYVSANGAAEILAVGDLSVARQLKAERSARVLLGERHGIRPPDFDFGNSPAEIERVDFSGRTVIHTTSAGTQGIAAATSAEEVIAGSFVNAGAIVAHIRARNPAEVSLVCMGQEAREPTDEDTLCAEFLRAALRDEPRDFAHIRAHLRGYWTAAKFFDPDKTWAPERDFELCLALDRFDFVLGAERIAAGVCRLVRR